MPRPALCLSILPALALLTALSAASFEVPSAHPADSGLHARDPANARCPGWDDLEDSEQGRSEDRRKVLLELTQAVAKDPTDAKACLKLARALRAVGRDAEAQRLEEQAAYVSGFCLVKTRKGT